MAAYEYGITDFHYIAAGAAILASGGGGSYRDAGSILDELAESGWNGTVLVQEYDGITDCCVLAMMGSPDKADKLTLTDIQNSLDNALATLGSAANSEFLCAVPVEIGPINSLVPLLAAASLGNSVLWVVNGDGAGRAVPQLPQTTYSGSANLAVSPSALANDADTSSTVQSAVLNADTAAAVENLAGGIVAAFGSFSGLALWPSNTANGHALTGNYIPGTLTQAWTLGQYLLSATTPPTTAEVAAQIAIITGRNASVTVSNFYITAVTQSTTDASLDTGVIRLDNTPEQAHSTQTCFIYNLNENLIMYSSSSATPDIIAPDSICYYSESTGRGFSNASDDLALYFDSASGKSTGKTVSIIQIQTATQLYNTPGVVASFADLLRQIGYAGAMPAT